VTEYELMEIFSNFVSSMHAWVTTFPTTLTAYLIAAYMAGVNLARFQVMVINIGFIWFGGLCAFAATSSGRRCVEISQEIMAINPSREMALTDGVVTAA